MPVRQQYAALFPSDEAISDALSIFIRVHGGPQVSVRSKDVYEPLADFFKLSAAARSVTRSEYYTDDARNELAWHNRVQWARRSLNKWGELAPSPRSEWRLSEYGIRRADERIACHPPRAEALEGLNVPARLVSRHEPPMETLRGFQF